MSGNCSGKVYCYVNRIHLRSSKREKLFIDDLSPAQTNKASSRLRSSITVARHHPLELLEIHVAVAIGIHRLDHPLAVLDRAPHVQLVQHRVELLAGDQAVAVAVVEVEGVAELRLGGGGGGSAERGELREVDEAVLVGVDLLHGAADVRGGGGGGGAGDAGGGGGEGGEDVVELVGGDLAVAVGVELVEDALEVGVGHVMEVEGGAARVRHCGCWIFPQGSCLILWKRRLDGGDGKGQEKARV